MMRQSILIILIFISGCAVSIPSNQDDICKILDENPRWRTMLYNSSEKWGSEPSTLMAIIRQESSFDPNAAPEREKILGIIPWKRPSSARGYSQAVDATWDQYKKETGNYRASRSSFESSVDFVGWYLSKALERYHPTKSTELSNCLLYTSPSPRDATLSRMPSSA